MNITRTGEYLAVAGALVAGSIWLGVLSADTAANKKAIEEQAANTQQIATLTERVENVKESIEDLKRTNSEILRELRKQR